MRNSRLKSLVPGITAVLFSLLGMYAGKCPGQNTHTSAGRDGKAGQQAPHNDFIKSASTKSGSVTYVDLPVGGFDINIFSKAAGEPTDFAGAVQRAGANKKEVLFAMNGGKCDKGLAPLALLIKGDAKYKDFVSTDKDIFGAPAPSGVFAIDRSENVRIIPAKTFKAADDLATYRLAVQSGTMLLTRGFVNPNITRAVNQQLSNGIGIKANGDIVFAVTDAKMSLREFAGFFQQMGCQDAMLLDDGANCQWYAPGAQKKPGKAGEILTVTRK